MKAHIQDRAALNAISPAAMSAYARASGWTKIADYGKHSDVYSAEGKPELILPRNQNLADYMNVVSHVIRVFAETGDIDELVLYRELITADRDVVRIQAKTDDAGGSVAVGDGVNLLHGAREMLLAAACSLKTPKRLYRAAANQEATNFVNSVRLGQTDQSSYVINLLTPTIAPPLQKTLGPEFGSDDPLERRVTKRLAQALDATREATDRTVAGGGGSFVEAVGRGVSVNLCEALVELISSFPQLDTSIVWARTRPMKSLRQVVRFSSHDAPILSEAARTLRERKPELDVRIVGFVHRLTRPEKEMDGTVELRALINGKHLTVSAVLPQSDYERAIQAHKSKSIVVMAGDLERVGQRWKLLHSRIADVAAAEESESGD